MGFTKNDEKMEESVVKTLQRYERNFEYHLFLTTIHINFNKISYK